MSSEFDGEIQFLTDEPLSSHFRSEIVLIKIGGDIYALPRYEAKEFFRGLATTLGCLNGFDADVYTDINGMVRDE